jgi:RCC1-like G exchanging factor-like protein
VSVGSTGSSCIVSNQKGEVYTWGSQILGFGPAIMEMSKPMLLDPPLFSTASGQDAFVQKVFAGNTVMGALTKNGNLYTWGSNRFGGLGLNHTKDQFFPYQVYLPNSVKTVSFGPDHSLFVTG